MIPGIQREVLRPARHLAAIMKIRLTSDYSVNRSFLEKDLHKSHCAPLQEGVRCSLTHGTEFLVLVLLPRMCTRH